MYDWRLLLLLPLLGRALLPFCPGREVATLGRELDVFADGRVVVPTLPETPAVGLVVAPLTVGLLEEPPAVGLLVVGLPETLA